MSGLVVAVVFAAMPACDTNSAPTTSRPSAETHQEQGNSHAGHNHGPDEKHVADECGAHGLASSTCPFCKPELVPAGGMCGEHGVPEALCWICRPELKASYERLNDWCGGHDRPESLCFICNPEREAIVAKIMGLSTGGVSAKSIDVSETPRSQRAPAVHCSTTGTQVRLASTAVAASAGFAFDVIESREISQTLTCNAEIAYDANRYARVSPRVSGVVHSVLKDAGASVIAGDVLAVVDSAELAIAKAEFLQAVETKKLWEKNHDAVHALVERGIAGSQEDLAAENKLAEAGINFSKATQQLKVLGLNSDKISEVESSQDTSPLLSLTAPFEGEIVERSAVIGETVDSSRALFTVADTRLMWAELDVYERDIALVRAGHPVVVSVDGLRGESFAGNVTWVSRQIDPKTRTLRVRAELANEHGDLRANMFGKAEITVHDREALVVVPKSAVQWDGCCNVAFVKADETTFEPRKLKLGIESGDYIQVRDGLKAGETVVTQGSFMLKTEIMKSSIGGCCEAK
ncbi:MAG: efflux RND transporter periplasmic adaptor subunit [Planctomycetes bacterium]|nr:efflux RND transporter periplasmic adaptor subunit [Planctomycetota bacterium]